MVAEIGDHHVFIDLSSFESVFVSQSCSSKFVFFLDELFSSISPDLHFPANICLCAC